MIMKWQHLMEFLDSFIQKTEPILIDGVSTSTASKVVDWMIDYKKMKDFFLKETRLIKSYYFTPLDVSQDDSNIMKLLDWLSFNGYITVLVEWESDIKSSKPTIDVEFTVTALKIACKADHLILFAGGGKYVPLVKRLNDIGKTVTICSTVKGPSRIVSDELRKCADNFIELDDLRAAIERSDKNNNHRGNHDKEGRLYQDRR